MPNKPKSNWAPKKNHHTINIIIEAVDSDIWQILEHKQNLTFAFTNFSKAEKTILNEFSKRDDLVFTKTHKEGATVMPDV